jgi:signal transduction histidine kinase
VHDAAGGTSAPPPAPPCPAPESRRAAARIVLAAALTGRMLVALVPTAVLVTTYGAVRLGPIVPLAAGLAAGNLVALLVTHRRSGHDGADPPASLLIIDTAIAGAVNVSASAAFPGSLGAPFWGYLVTTVALVTGLRGVRAGLLIVAASGPLQAAMTAVTARPPALATLLGRELWLGIALALALVVLAAVTRGTERAALAGQAAERSRLMRSMHDTVLQTLEAMSLAAELDRTSPEAALAQLRSTARQQAARLRRELAEAPSSPLADSLAEVVDEVGARGLRATLVLVDAGADRLTPARREALRDATREALTNAAKHSGAADAVVRVDAVDGGVEVVVRDRGRGFAADEPHPGFGIRESLVARMRDAGGRADVESWPGRGTRVRLWAPA